MTSTAATSSARVSSTEYYQSDAQAIFDDEKAATTMVQFPKFGIYELMLTAEDSVAVVTDTVRVEVISPTCADVIAEGLLLVGDISGPDGTPDCRVDLIDFAVMALDWLACNDPAEPECMDPYNGN